MAQRARYGETVLARKMNRFLAPESEAGASSRRGAQRARGRAASVGLHAKVRVQCSLGEPSQLKGFRHDNSNTSRASRKN
jgi:hypothetical protein